MASLDRPADPTRYTRTLKDVAAALREAGVRFALFGSTALWGTAGREPRTVEDIDLLIEPGQVDEAAKALVAAGLEVEVPPEGWLIKAWKRGPGDEPDVLIDLIHEPAGLDAAAGIERAVTESLEGMQVKVVQATDLLVSKALTLGPSSLDAQSAVEFARLLREQVDWTELEQRVSGSPYARALLFLLQELEIAPR